MQRPSDGGTVATAAAARRRPAPASPSSVTRLADKLSQLTVADGGSAASAHVAWAVALKAPSSSQVLLVDGSDAKREWRKAAADEWLAGCILSQVPQKGGLPLALHGYMRPQQHAG